MIPLRVPSICNDIQYDVYGRNGFKPYVVSYCFLKYILQNEKRLTDQRKAFPHLGKARSFLLL